ncbi:MAG: hypothetical protein K2W82_08265 [Candidatus Obscuribacterales bacterium]|nr:hypothetical protein [Candidatus Obscuribacterales bacterium]
MSKHTAFRTLLLTGFIAGNLAAYAQENPNNMLPNDNQMQNGQQQQQQQHQPLRPRKRLRQKMMNKMMEKKEQKMEKKMEQMMQQQQAPMGGQAPMGQPPAAQ